MADETPSWGTELKRRIAVMQMNQASFARKFKIKDTTVSSWVSKPEMPRIDEQHVIKLCKAFGFSGREELRNMHRPGWGKPPIEQLELYSPWEILMHLNNMGVSPEVMGVLSAEVLRILGSPPKSSSDAHRTGTSNDGPGARTP